MNTKIFLALISLVIGILFVVAVANSEPNMDPDVISPRADCTLESNQDKWNLEDMSETHGKGTYKFSYWNSLSRCSADRRQGVYIKDGSFRVEMLVQVLGRNYDNQERIIIIKEGWVIEPVNLLLHDSDEAGVIWIKAPMM